MEWFNDLSLFEKVYWLLASIGSLILVVILIMTFVGGEIDADVDLDGDGAIDGGAGFQFFTFKNLVGFITIFGWTGIGCIRSGMSTFGVLSVSVVCGLIMMLLMTLLFYAISGMVESGNMRMSNALGRTGEVYLPIVANNGGFGKVQINIQGSIHEIQAFTNDDRDLKVGTIVKVERVIDDSILLVTSKIN
jgi:membrane protein implicated in regulation of membrane protease activity